MSALSAPVWLMLKKTTAKQLEPETSALLLEVWRETEREKKVKRIVLYNCDSFSSSLWSHVLNSNGMAGLHLVACDVTNRKL